MQFLRRSTRLLGWQTSLDDRSTNYPCNCGYSWISLEASGDARIRGFHGVTSCSAGNVSFSAARTHLSPRLDLAASLLSVRGITTQGNPINSRLSDASANQPARIMFKKLGKTARHIRDILDIEVVDEVKA